MWEEQIYFTHLEKAMFTAVLDLLNPKCANRNKSRLLFLSAEMFKKPLSQTVRT